MAQIVSLTQTKRDPNRYTLELDTGEKLTVTVAHIADYSLYTGAKLDEETLVSLRGDAERSRIRARALRILGSRAMSRAEMVRSLTDKGEDEAAAEETADWLESLGAIDDVEYAASVVRHYAAKGYGLGRIRSELHRRGIGRALWDDALANLPEEMDGAAFDALCAILRRAPVSRDRLRRAGQALARRGFSWGEAQSAMRRYIEEFGEEELDEE
jgi:regulatory protein